MKINKRLHEEGTKAIMITLAVIVAVVFVVNWIWPLQSVWHYLLYLFLTVVVFLTVRFFRVPIWRKTTIEKDAVLAPADGVIAANEVVMEDDILGSFYWLSNRSHLLITSTIPSF